MPPVEEDPEEEEEAEQAPNMPWEEADADGEEDESWDAIDAIHPLLCAVSPFAQLQDVPATLVNEWVHTQNTVFERACRAHRSGNQADLDRALKWFLVLPQVLLRAPSRGGRRGGAAGEVEARFRAWRQGEYGTVLRWWKAHRQKERQRNATKEAMGAPDEAHLVDRALVLLEQGQISLAMNMLHSTGLGDLQVTAILDQLVGKHPRRKMPVPHELDAEEVGPGLHNLEMAEQFRKLKRMKAAGVGGGRNEYLKPLAHDFEDRGLDRLRQHTNEFATFFARGEFPEWFYFLEGATRVVAPIKPTPGGLRAQQPQVPDVRPVGIGDCFRRAVCSAAAAQCKEAAAEYLSPQQVAVGVPGGISVLVHAVRLALEANPGQVVVKCDLKNAFNEVQRATMIDRVLHSPVKAIAPLLHALYKHSTHIYINKNGGRLRGGAEGDSQEGAQQGCALAAMAFCIAIHPEVLRLDERLRETGGFVICDMDDVYAVGAPDTVFQAVAGFATDVRAIGLELVPRKSICYSPRLREQLEVDPHRLLHLSACTVGRAGTDQEEAAYGMVVAGVPVGDAAFVAQHMDGVTGGIVSKVKKTVSMLQHRSPQALHTLIFYTIQPLLVFWLQHLPPQQVLPYAERVDEAVLEAFAAAVGASTEDLQEPLTNRRVRLPARWYGCGIRSMVEQATPAYAATTAGILPRLADRQVDGRLLQGLCPPLTQWLGQGAFDEGAERTRFSHFLGTNSATAAALGESWRQMQAVVGEVAEGPLSARCGGSGRAHSWGEMRETAEGTHSPAGTGEVHPAGGGHHGATGAGQQAGGILERRPLQHPVGGGMALAELGPGGTRVQRGGHQIPRPAQPCVRTLRGEGTKELPSPGGRPRPQHHKRPHGQAVGRATRLPSLQAPQRLATAGGEGGLGPQAYLRPPHSPTARGPKGRREEHRSGPAHVAPHRRAGAGGPVRPQDGARRSERLQERSLARDDGEVTLGQSEGRQSPTGIPQTRRRDRRAQQERGLPPTGGATLGRDPSGSSAEAAGLLPTCARLVRWSLFRSLTCSGPAAPSCSGARLHHDVEGAGGAHAQGGKGPLRGLPQAQLGRVGDEGERAPRAVQGGGPQGPPGGSWTGAGGQKRVAAQQLRAHSGGLRCSLGGWHPTRGLPRVEDHMPFFVCPHRKGRGSCGVKNQ